MILVVDDFAYCLSIACTISSFISSFKDKILEEVQYHFHLFYVYTFDRVSAYYY